MKSILIQNTIAEAKTAGPHPVTAWLEKNNSFWFTVFVSLTAFGLYTCIYAFRKTFAAATYADQAFLGVEYKVWLVTFQVCGYAVSKFIGIKLIAELQASSRSKGILVIVLIAGLSWLLFGLMPAPLNILCLFLNGLALGLAWGMVFSYLEGRKVTEALGAALSVSFIFSSGLCRSAGAYLIRDWNVSENWMPLIASCLFFIPLSGFLYLLNKVPPPTPEDEALRTKRMPMNSKNRKKFIRTFLPGIVLFVMAYMLLTAFRDFRDNFSAEVWKELGYGNSPGIYTTTEIPVSIAVLVVMASIMLVKKNKLALMVNHLIIIAGMIIIGGSTLLFENQMIGPVLWMTLMGLGLYLGYVPFNSIFFDRMIAAFQYIGTVGFIMYVADAFGYLGSVGVLFFKQFGSNDASWLEFFISTGYVFSVIGSSLILGSMIYFHFKHKQWSRT
jgi:MFS family permease